MNSEEKVPKFLQNSRMKVIDTRECFKLNHDVSIESWVADGHKIGDGYCLKGM